MLSILRFCMILALGIFFSLPEGTRAEELLQTTESFMDFIVKPNIKVIDGDPVYQGDMPWMVAILKDSQHYGSGFMIDDIHLLTAGHVCKGSENGLTTRIGNVELRKCDPYEVEWSKPHENFTGSLYDASNDICLIKLKQAVYSEWFYPLFLPTQELQQQNMEGEVATAAGWGYVLDENNNEVTTDFLMRLDDIPLVPYNQCARYYSNLPKHGVVCAGFKNIENKDVCNGDSGGPLMYWYRGTWYAYGLVSYNLGCGKKGVPSVYTEISYFLPWIQKNM